MHFGVITFEQEVASIESEYDNIYSPSLLGTYVQILLAQVIKILAAVPLCYGVLGGVSFCILMWTGTILMVGAL